jgi:hypothetical protein
MFMKAIFVTSSFAFLLATNLFAEDSKTILIQKGNEKDFPAKVFVESGSDEIMGSPEDGIKPAYRTWDQKCTEWKNQLERLNGKNLLNASCGTPKRTGEKVNSEQIYTYQSTGKYKIKVLGK